MEGKKRLNILILSWRGPGHPNAGGAEISTHEHAKYWVGAGCDVTLFTSDFAGAAKEQILDGVRIIRRGSQKLGVHFQAVMWYLFSSHKKYDLVIDEFHGIPFFIPIYVRSKKLAFIHEVAKEVWKTNFSAVPAKLGEMLEPQIFRLYRNIPFMTVSESTKDDLIKWGISKDNIKVIHNGVNVLEVPKAEKEIKKTIIFLGALAKDKGIEEAIEAFTYLRGDFQFWIVGKGNPIYLKFLKEKTKSLGLTNIKFWGFVTEQKKFELLKRAHLLINPSIREGWGLVVIEAAACSTPTVAFDVPGLRDSIVNGKTGVLCSENTAINLAENILKLLQNKKRYHQMKQDALFWSRNFSWKKAGFESLKLIKNLIKKG